MRRDASIEVGKFLDAAAEPLQLTLLSDWGELDRKITSMRIQKPGLALSGFVKHVFPDRIQVLGLTEIDYLLSCSPEQARAGLEAFCSKPLCCLAISRGLDPPDFLMDVARRHGVPVLRSPLMSSVFISRLTRKLEDLLSPRATIHGVLIDVLGVGLLLIGRSGVGKSEAALDLILKGHRLVADDIVEVSVRPPDTVWGAALEMHQHHMEIRGLGILNITHLFGVAAVRDNKKIEVVVELSEAQEEDYDRLGTEPQVWPILGVDVPLARIPLRPGRNIASLIEVVARNQVLKFRGHDSAREFQEKINARIAASARGANIRSPGPDVPVPTPRASSGAVPSPEVE
ncbi:HPr(Ser) kinase/phosphatase [Nannocystis pusilla]|uniref:HPr kinase/phosphorylase n=1 Tax=Nannocystis pusilla TaxID=889268 RepID=A0A9X3EPF0_9BACT|nr:MULTISPECIES: HPr(Ser) kinase/phosphatase [Nannocystis]MCY0990096.1 HPr(Ser) kinase/phosphatase [Nannocystis sp. ILAH1]MCY1007505.1 HPr(Ser) kinase/phosphatase [Nannocystis pusilla]MCY1069615.1 HPr(Ser) kinase/phosphatase [Nannocystis sp. RBIL2]